VDLGEIKVIGYDLDYTLVHYNVETWEGAVYESSKLLLSQKGFDVEGLKFDPELVCRGLIIDTHLGNAVKVDRYGYISMAMHGTTMLSHERVSEIYGRPRRFVDLRDERWVFLNTLFSVASGGLFLQLVERMKEPESGTYAQLSQSVESAVSQTHIEGKLKGQIIKDPSEYVVLDAEAPLAVLDQRLAGKKIVLITNNDWEYVKCIMAYAYDRYLPQGMTWRSLFDIIIVNARKPNFWKGTDSDCWRVIDEAQGLNASTPVTRIEEGSVYCGGNARFVEECFGYERDEIMYIGDHIYSDASYLKRLLQWRTCLVLRELEEEVKGLALSQRKRDTLGRLLQVRDSLHQQRSELMARATRWRLGFRKWASDGPSSELWDAALAGCEGEDARVWQDVAAMEARLAAMDDEVMNLVHDVGSIEGLNPRWGFLTRVGYHDKSHLMRQVEKYADLYTSRISNFLACTPHGCLRTHLQTDRNLLGLGDVESLATKIDHLTFSTSSPPMEEREWEDDAADIWLAAQSPADSNAMAS